jgi:hypothetical protein
MANVTPYGVLVGSIRTHRGPWQCVVARLGNGFLEPGKELVGPFSDTAESLPGGIHYFLRDPAGFPACPFVLITYRR